VLRSTKDVLIAAAIFSGVINVLALSGSLFMLQVYDRVLPSRSLPTLAALVVLIVVVYAFTAALELVRTRLFARLGRHVDAALGPSIFELSVRRAFGGTQAPSAAPFRDLEQLRSFFSGGGPAAIFDLPWTPLYVVLLFMLHPLIGVMGVAGIISLSFLTWRTDRATGPTQREGAQATAEANALAETTRRAAETITPMGMTAAFKREWTAKNQEAGRAVLSSGDATSLYGGVSRFIRMALQSLVLALGAALVISGEASGGVMIASSILLGRALAPVELAIAHWKGFVGARQAYGRLQQSLEAPATAPETELPAPFSRLVVEGLFVAAGGGQPFLRDISFDLQAGDALGVIGPSGAGKSTLGRALVGALPAAKGAVRLDGSTLDQWSEDARGRFVGYLPQEVELFSGTVSRNIGRFRQDATSEAVVRAAEVAGVAGFVRGLQGGFDAEVGDRGGRLSAGQKQRIALARALYEEPFLVVLDEPNSALDAEGEAGLTNAISAVRARGGIAIVIAHRSAALQATNKVLMLQGGQQKAFGPRDEVLKRVLAPVPARAAPELREAVS